jgi:hypothetical protein
LDHKSSDPRLAVHPQHASYDGLPWRCRVCGALLGVAQGGQLHVKYRDTELWVVGTCRRTCRRCGERNETTVGGPTAKEGT